MMTPTRTATVALALALASGWLPELARADMMTTCASQIASFCPGVSRGRGRITACLISYSDKVGAACNAEVQAVAQRGGNNPLVPPGVRTLLSSGQVGSLPAACAADAGRFCSSVTQTHERVLACLYAQGNRVSNACSSAVQASLN
jgi:Cysteine rich repeat